jgi:hypothetical protein
MGTGVRAYPWFVGFVLATVAMLLVLVGVLLVVGHFYPGSSADLVDWKPTRSPELEAQNEIDDIQQMLEAQNAIRRRRGAPDRTEQELREEVEADEIARLRRQGQSGTP